MLKSTNKVDTNKYEITVDVSADDLENAVQKVYRRRAKNITIPGFRKGKASRKMIEKLYGETFFYEDAVNALLPEHVTAAINEAKLTPVVRPDVEVTSLGKDTGVTFLVTAICKPEVTVSDYKGIEAEKTVKDITDEDINAQIENLRQRQGRLVVAEDRAAENNDTVVIDFEGFIDGTPFDGGKEENYELKLGSGYFIPGFEDQIVGHNKDDEFTVNVTFPENYQMKEVAGKPAEFRVKLHEIKTLELPEVDDDFVKDISEFDSVDELKADIKKQLTEKAEQFADRQFEDKVFDTVIEKMSAEVPNEMYETRINESLKEFEMRLQMQGLTLQTYLSYTGSDEKTFRESFRPNAEKQVKLRLALEKIAILEGIEISDDAVNAEIEKIASENKITPAQVLQIVTRESIKEDLMVAKAADLVKENAKVA